MRPTIRVMVLVAAVLVLAVPAQAQETPWSIGLGVSGGNADPDVPGDIDLTAFTLLGRWQHANNGWGAMAEFRDGEDDEDLIDLDYNQINLYATYTWLRDGIARPFVKFGLSNTDVSDGPDDTALIVGGGVEVGRGRWAFHASVDATEPELGVDTEVRHLTLGATFRF